MSLPHKTDTQCKYANIYPIFIFLNRSKCKSKCHLIILCDGFFPTHSSKVDPIRKKKIFRNRFSKINSAKFLYMSIIFRLDFYIETFIFNWLNFFSKFFFRCKRDNFINFSLIGVYAKYGWILSMQIQIFSTCDTTW